MFENYIFIGISPFLSLSHFLEILNILYLDHVLEFCSSRTSLCDDRSHLDIIILLASHTFLYTLQHRQPESIVESLYRVLSVLWRSVSRSSFYILIAQKKKQVYFSFVPSSPLAGPQSTVRRPHDSPFYILKHILKSLYYSSPQRC